MDPGLTDQGSRYDYLHHDFSPKHWLWTWNEQFTDFFSLEALRRDFYCLLSDTAGNFLAVQWLGLHTSTAWGSRLIPSWRIKILQVAVKRKSESVTHSIMSNSFQPMDCSPPGCSVHGIFQARILEPFPSPADLPNPGIELGLLLQKDSLLSKPTGKSASCRAWPKKRERRESCFDLSYHVKEPIFFIKAKCSS